MSKGTLKEANNEQTAANGLLHSVQSNKLVDTDVDNDSTNTKTRNESSRQLLKLNLLNRLDENETVINSTSAKHANEANSKNNTNKDGKRLFNFFKKSKYSMYRLFAKKLMESPFYVSFTLTLF